MQRITVALAAMTAALAIAVVSTGTATASTPATATSAASEPKCPEGQLDEGLVCNVVGGARGVADYLLKILGERG